MRRFCFLAFNVAGLLSFSLPRLNLAASSPTPSLQPAAMILRFLLHKRRGLRPLRPRHPPCSAKTLQRKWQTERTKKRRP